MLHSSIPLYVPTHVCLFTSARESFPFTFLVGGMKPPEMSIPSHGRHVNIPVGISHPSFSSFSLMNFTFGPVVRACVRVCIQNDV